MTQSTPTVARPTLPTLSLPSRPLQELQFAKSKSDATARRDGSWKQKEAMKRKAEGKDQKEAKKKQAKDVIITIYVKRLTN